MALDALAEGATVECATFQALMARKYFVRGINYLDEKYGEFGSDAELSFQIRRAGRKMIVLRDVPVIRTAVPVQRSTAAQNVLDADRVHGAAVFFGKHYGFMTALAFRIKAILKALVSLRFSLMTGLIGGQKVDGSQSVIL